MAYKYLIRSFEFPTGTKEMNTTEMIKFAKHTLRHNKRMGYDKGVTQKDLDMPINAWVYLRNVGLGIKTDRTKWEK